MPDTRRTLPLSPNATDATRSTSPDAPPAMGRPSSNGIPRPIESPHRAAAPPPAGSLTAALATTQFARGSDAHAINVDAAQTMQFAAAVTKPMAANPLDFDDPPAERTSTNLLARSAAILQCVPHHAVYDSYETNAAFIDDASTRLRPKQSPAAVATGVMRPNARVVFPALPAVQLASGTTPPSSTSVPPDPAPGRVGTLPPEARTAFVPSQSAPQEVIAPHPSSPQPPASNASARTVFEPQPTLAAARPAFPLPAPSASVAPGSVAAGSVAPSNAATQFERPGVPRAKSPSDRLSLHDDNTVQQRDSSADIQRAVQAALDQRRAVIAGSFSGASGLARDAPEQPTMLVAPLMTVRAVAREQVHSYEREAKTARLYMLLAVLTCVLAPVAWIHAEEQLMRSNALVFRIERALGLALTLAAVAAIACGITVLVVR